MKVYKVSARGRWQDDFLVMAKDEKKARCNVLKYLICYEEEAEDPILSIDQKSHGPMAVRAWPVAELSSVNLKWLKHKAAGGNIDNYPTD